MTPRFCLALLVALAAACGSGQGGDRSGATSSGARPWILLLTLDTKRAAAIRHEDVGASTPPVNANAARGLRFRQAYATVPETFPSHASIMTGLYPGGHAIHENGRALASTHPVMAERLQQAGYRTLATVSSFTLARRFGLARGFDVYDDALPYGQV